MDPPSQDFALKEETNSWRQTLILSFQSLGIVFSQLSIGPLYVFSTAASNGVKSEDMLFGHLSFIFWTMTLIPLVKYAFITLNADDNGKGGTFSLYSLLCQHAQVGLLPYNQVADDTVLAYEMGCYYQRDVRNENKWFKNSKKSRYLMLFMALIGSSIVISAGVLVPVLSVFSASIGLAQSLSGTIFRTSGDRENYNTNVEVPTACAVLVVLFVLQHYGTNKIGFLFAPIIFFWLLFIGGVGLYNIIHINPRIVTALSPCHIYKFIKSISIGNLRPLSGILLSIAGSEAMFANLGHSSKRSIKAAFIILVYPSLILCYMGQAAYLSKKIGNDDMNYVTHLIASLPSHLLGFFGWFSLLASVVGSQASISATFSIINQCIALGCFPEVTIVHTSDKIQGQVYIPDINWILALLCLFITILFKNVHHIGNAVGLATIIGMIVTSCFMSLTISLHWNNRLAAISFIAFFGIIEATYFVACALNFIHGSWLLVILAVLTFAIMMSWHYGTVKMHDADAENMVLMEHITNLSHAFGINRVPGIGFVFTEIIRGIPPFFSHFTINFPAIHQMLIFVSFKSVPVAHLPPSMQCLVGRLGPKQWRMYRCILRHGYADNILDINELENQIIHGICELISKVNDENSNIIIASNFHDGLVFSGESEENGENGRNPARKVRFVLPPDSPVMCSSAREELQDLIDAQEHGATYIYCHPYLSSSKGSHFLKKFLIEIYIFLQKNCRKKFGLVNIPNAAYVEVGMHYSI